MLSMYLLHIWGFIVLQIVFKRSLSSAMHISGLVLIPEEILHGLLYLRNGVLIGIFIRALPRVNAVFLMS